MPIQIPSTLPELCRLRPDAVRRAEHLAADADARGRAPVEQLHEALAITAAASALVPDDGALRDAVEALHRAQMGRCADTERRAAMREIDGMLEMTDVDPLPLLEMARRETDVATAAAAVRWYAIRRGTIGPEMVDGCVTVMHAFEQPDTTPTARCAMLSGLLDFGDEIALPLVRGRWRDIDPALRRHLAVAPEHAITLLRLEFLLDWLGEADDGADVAAITALLESLPEQVAGIVSIRHERLPSMAEDDPDLVDDDPCAPPDGPQCCTWTDPIAYRQYADVLAERLEPLCARPGGERHFTRIVEAWRHCRRRIDLEPEHYFAV